MSVIEAVAQINRADIAPKTRNNAMALLEHVHPDNGYACLSWEALSELFGGASFGVVRRHLGEMHAVNLVHYSSNGDGLVYLTFKAWTPASGSRAHARKSTKNSTKNVEKVVEKRAPTRDPEPDDEQTARAHARKTSKNSTKNARGRAITYTHASAPDLDGWMEDPISDRDHPSIPADEQQQSLKLLLAARVTAKEAGPLAAVCPFVRVQDCVGGWWMNRKSMGGVLENEPGIVVHWLKTGKAPRAYDEHLWQREDLYRMHAPAAEPVEQLPPEPPATLPATPARASPAYLEDDPGWHALQADAVIGAEVAGVLRIEVVDDRLPCYVLDPVDPLRIGWLKRLIPKWQRMIAQSVGYPVLIVLEGEE